MKKRWWIFFLIYLVLLIIGTLGIRGRSLLEWVQLLIPPGYLRDLLVYPLQHHHPVIYAKFLNLADRLVNIFLFIPLGMGMFFVFHRTFPDSFRKLLLTTLFIGMLLSMCIEAFQYLVPKRIPSVSDIIANTGGAVFGCYILCFRKMYQKTRITKEQSLNSPRNPQKDTK
jgi:VanZ family protein